MKKVLLTLVGVVFAAILGAAALVYSGLYDISATDQHLAPTYRILDLAMRRSVDFRADRLEVPRLDDPAMRERGLALYEAHCVQCHGAPGVAPQPFALGLTPVAANLAHTARAWTPAELYWVVKHGIKMTGMPAWSFRMEDADLWAVVAFVETLPELSPARYQVLRAQLQPRHPAAAEPRETVDRGPEARAASLTATDEASVARGRLAMSQYACVTCHRIPGVVGPNAPVGPPLEHMASRAFIAGILPNTPENMIRWLRNPQEVSPITAMPDLGVTEQHARDMTAFLATLE